MKINMELRKRIEKAEKAIDRIEKEIVVRRYCNKHGLDYEAAADYSRAVMAVGKNADEELLTSNNVAPVEAECYNINDITDRLDTLCARLENISRYGFWKNLKHRIGQKLFGQVVRNCTRERIAIVGETREKPGDVTPAYLYPGQSSSGKYEDVDAVLIIPGQKYYRSKMDMQRDGEIVNTGAIKVRGGLGAVEVYQSKKKPDVLYVNSYTTTYYREPSTADPRWRLP